MTQLLTQLKVAKCKLFSYSADICTCIFLYNNCTGTPYISQWRWKRRFMQWSLIYQSDTIVFEHEGVLGRGAGRMCIHEIAARQYRMIVGMRHFPLKWLKWLRTVANSFISEQGDEGHSVCVSVWEKSASVHLCICEPVCVCVCV